jgi:hypothetical protein
MSRFAHHIQPAQAAALAEEFELVQARYVAAPALLWAVAMAAALLVTAVQVVPERTARPAPAADSCLETLCTVEGA